MKNLLFILFFFFLLFTGYSQTWQQADSICNAFENKGDYEAALPYAEKAIEIASGLYLECDSVYLYLLEKITNIYYNTGNLAKELEYSLKNKEIRKNMEMGINEEYANLCIQIGLIYTDMGKHNKALELYSEVLKIKSLLSGSLDSSYAATLNDLAHSNRLLGNYNESESLYNKALEIIRNLKGENNIEYAVMLNQLANLYRDMGNYIQAESVYEKSLSIMKMNLEETDSRYFMLFSDIGLLYNAMGNFPAAESNFLKVIEHLKNANQTDKLRYGITLNNLAISYRASKKYEEAEMVYNEALRIVADKKGETHPDYAQILNNLAILYLEMQKYELAENILLKVKEIWSVSYGEYHPYYANCLNSLGTLYLRWNRLEEAEAILNTVKNIRLKILGNKHPSYSSTIGQLALLNEKMGKNTEASEYHLEHIMLMNDKLLRNFSILSEKEKTLLFEKEKQGFDDFYSFCFLSQYNTEELSKEVFNCLLRNKGLLLKSVLSMRTSVTESNDTSLIRLYDKWIDLKKEITKLYLTESRLRTQDPANLEDMANETEKKLVRHSMAFSEYEKTKNANWESVKKSLNPGEAAIEFIHFSDDLSDNRVIYGALLITDESAYPVMVNLFEESEIIEIYDFASENSLNHINRLYGTKKQSSEFLYNLIWKPLESYLKNTHTVYYSPDGILHKISFPALAKEENVFLCDLFNLNQLSSTGILASSVCNQTVKGHSKVALFGGIDYSEDSISPNSWKYLPGTLNEIQKIEKLLSKNKLTVTSYVAQIASEETIKTIASECDILHVSTHGFFFSNPEEVKVNNKVEIGHVTFRGNDGFGLWQYINNKNPLMRSGLVMANANKVWTDPYPGTDNDGVFTAQEVTQLNMVGTQLVVLSACETGLGDIKGSEGVYGLQRAFKMAGVKYIIMSLWQVPDKETVEFMETFYKKLLKTKDVRLSFNETQKEMRKKYDPYYWAAFVLIE